MVAHRLTGCGLIGFIPVGCFFMHKCSAAINTISDQRCAPIILRGFFSRADRTNQQVNCRRYVFIRILSFGHFVTLPARSGLYFIKCLVRFSYSDFAVVICPFVFVRPGVTDLSQGRCHFTYQYGWFPQELSRGVVLGVKIPVRRPFLTFRPAK